MKKVLTLFLAILSLGPLFSSVSCTDQPKEDPTDDENKMVSIVIDGASDYRIIRNDLYTTADDIVQAAIALRAAVTAATGCEMDIKTDYEDEVPLEIIVGDTAKRAAGALIPADLANNEFVILYQDGKLLISGSDGLSTVKAVEYFITTYLGYDAATGTYSKNTLSIPADLHYRGTFDYPTTVYLVGDIKTLPNGGGHEIYNDIVRLISSLQGRLNKDAAKNNFYIYQTFDSKDQFWLDYLSAEGKMFDGAITVTLNSWDDVWEAFGSYIQEAGMVLWDEEVPSTANVAATICAVEGYLPVRYDRDDSLYAWLSAHGVSVKEDLCDRFDGRLGTTIDDTDVPSTGSTKCDAYLWALEKYGDRCNSTMLAYTLDGASTVVGNPIEVAAEGKAPNWNQLYSHDYLIMNSCFFFDLTCNDKELPCDDPEQPMGTDAETLHKILSFFCEKNNGKMGKLMGFPPWYMKYTKHLGHGSLEPTTLEWDFVEFISAYNFIKEADAAHPAWMTNGSVYTQYVSTSDYKNNKIEPTEIFDSKTRYFTIYMGDYDSSAWFKQHIPNFFNDSSRGKYPLMWAFNPNLGDRVPMVFDYVYENLTENDVIVTGDSGAGYVIPAMLPDIDTWVDYNEPYLEKYDMDIVGFIINGNNKMTNREFEAYAEISPVGAFHNDSTTRLVVWEDETVFMHLMNGINPADLDNVAQSMYDYATRTGNNFSAYRTVCASPSQVNAAIDRFLEYAASKNDGYTYQCVDPYTLFDLVHQSGQAEYRYAD